MRSSIIKDPKLAPEGRQKIRWVEQHAPVLDRLTADAEEHRRRWQ
jgi:S-adenosylhomocysteine hydrolase